MPGRKNRRIGHSYKKNPASMAGFFCYKILTGLRGDNRDIRRLESFRTLLDIEFNLIAFVQALVAIACDRIKVDEHIIASAARNESETLCCVEPFDCSFFHGTNPF